MPSSVQTMVTLPGATSIMDAIEFLDSHGPGLERLLSAALGPKAKDLVEGLSEAVRRCDVYAARAQIDTMLDTLAEMAGDLANSADPPILDAALLWYCDQLSDLARTWREL